MCSVMPLMAQREISNEFPARCNGADLHLETCGRRAPISFSSVSSPPAGDPRIAGGIKAVE